MSANTDIIGVLFNFTSQKQDRRAQKESLILQLRSAEKLEEIEFKNQQFLQASQQDFQRVMAEMEATLKREMMGEEARQFDVTTATGVSESEKDRAQRLAELNRSGEIDTGKLETQGRIEAAAREQTAGLQESAKDDDAIRAQVEANMAEMATDRAQRRSARESATLQSNADYIAERAARDPFRNPNVAAAWQGRERGYSASGPGRGANPQGAGDYGFFTGLMGGRSVGGSGGGGDEGPSFGEKYDPDSMYNAQKENIRSQTAYNWKRAQ